MAQKWSFATIEREWTLYIKGDLAFDRISWMKSESTSDYLLKMLDERLASSFELYHADSIEACDGYWKIVDYLFATGSARRNLRHYASRTRVDQIISESSVYLSDGTAWNDKYDRENFNPPSSEYKNFGMCLSANTEESIAMWMLYGGIDGNGAMINFDKKTLKSAMYSGSYDFGYFDTRKRFRTVLTLDASQIKFRLMDVIYFDQSKKDEERFLLERKGEGKQTEISGKLSSGLHQIAKHKSWSYETEVRLVGSISKRFLGRKADQCRFLKIPLNLNEHFISSRIYDSPAPDGRGHFRQSKLFGTVEWNLCSDCKFKKAQITNRY